MNPRQFNIEAKQSSDLICRLEALRLFSKHPKYKAVLAEDFYPDDERAEFRVDILLIDRSSGAHTHNLEVEMKRAWKHSFPFHDIQFLPRKMEKWDDPVFTYGRPTHWLLFNHDASQHLVVFDSVIRNTSELRWVKCQVRGMEQLYCIPKQYAKFNYL